MKLNELYQWTQKWLLKLHISNYNVISLGSSVDNTTVYNICDSDRTSLNRVEQLKDLNILIDHKQSFREHLHYKTNKACAMLGIIKRNFKYLICDQLCFLV